MSKSYVTIQICPICQGEMGLLLDRRLKDSFEMKTCIPGQVCDKCEKKYLSKGVMLINPENGKLAVIKDEAFKRIFNKPLPPRKIGFADDAVINQLIA